MQSEKGPLYPVRLCRQCYIRHINGEPISIHLHARGWEWWEWVCDHWLIEVVADFLNQGNDDNQYKHE